MAGLGVGLDVSARQAQTQVLSHQMQQSLAMLAMTSVELRAELQRQMAQNPVIDDVQSRTERAMSEALPEEHTGAATTERELDFTPDGAAAQSILGTDDGYRDYFLGNLSSASGDEEAQTRRQRMFDLEVKEETLQEHLLRQVALSDIPRADRGLAESLIGNIDDDGYFRGSLTDIAWVSGTSEQKLLDILALIRTFDPMGCGARDLRECLLAQMEKLDDSPWEDEVRTLIDGHLPDVAAHREGELCRLLHVTPAEYAKILAELRTLDPKPGRNPSDGLAFLPRDRKGDYVRPEVFAVQTDDGAWKVRVDARDLPDIHISPRYQKMLADPNCAADVKSYIREKIRAAQTLRESLARRQDTIRNIAQAIVDAQPDFFEKGKEGLRPLTMQQIAEKTGVHNTTVSRTVKNKYIATPFGVVELGSFFTAGLSTASGERVSNVTIQDEIRRLIDAEDRRQPLADERIAEILKEKGIVIARRTVAKYRKALGIEGTNERRIK